MEEAAGGMTMLQQQQHGASSPLFPDHPPLPLPPPPSQLHLKPPAAPRSLGEPFHSRSRSQPAACFSFDSSPTTSLSDSLSMDDHDIAQVAAADSDLPPRGAHRRSQSDVPFAFLPPLPLPPGAGVKMEVQWDRGFDGEDLFSTYMNLDGFDMLTDGRENEAESNSSGAVQRGAAGDPALVTAASRHCRSLSMDSFMRKFNFEEEESAKLQPPRGSRARSSAKLVNSMGTEPSTFSLDFGNGQFTPPEMKKIMENEKLVELAMADPKRVKRILANRQSAARSKERKMRYIAELEHKVQLLQTETTAMSAQFTLLQRDSAGLVNQNNELKFRLQSMEQQAQLRDALNEALTAEVQRLKLAASGLVDAHDSTNTNQQTSLNARTMDCRQDQ
ncbi:bZIP transcription factor 29-like isoform X2 [Zingiber officinale]|uniref:bZIP transcription factor 29-like isoform X2 n=1 Tax=Zingiber officinale TaxID=94328 RepID=UPI001C4D351E|nr:bZIP transcription factor 29-like isoform X2 [Zingiber officinale]